MVRAAAGREDRHQATVTFLDTHDWRLHAKNLVLQHEDRDRHEMLVLRTVGRHDGLVLPARGAPASTRDLPPGPGAARIARIIGVRALVPMGAAVVVRQTWAVRDKSAKVVARVEVERTGVGPDWLHVVALRGYESEAARLGRRLSEMLGAPEDPPEPLAAAAAAVGRRPGDYSSKLAAGIDDNASAAEAITAVLAALVAAMAANETGVQARSDVEFLHDYRVAIRRMRSVLSVSDGVLPAGPVACVRDDLSWMANLTTPPRDLDVHLMDLAADNDPALDPLRALVAARCDQAHGALNQAMGSARYRTMIGRIEALVAEPTTEGPPAGDLAKAAIWRAYRRVARGGRAITESSPADDLHSLRKRAKKLRYLLEAFTPLFPAAALDPAVHELKQLQDNLGEFQDGAVQATALTALAEELAPTTPAATVLAIGALKAELGRRERAARVEFASRFARFDSPENRRRYRRLFGPPDDRAGR